MFSFIKELCESRMFPSIKSLIDLGTTAIAERLYLALLALRVLLADEQTREWAASYIRRTIQHNSFTRWRIDATDLYVLLHGLEAREGSQSQAYGGYRLNPVLLMQWLREASHGRGDEGHTKRLFVRLDQDLKIHAEAERALRRQVAGWEELSGSSRRRVVASLIQTIQNHAPRFELIQPLKTLHQDLAEAIVQETASLGATGVASVATCAAGGIGSGFDPNGHERSIYPAPKKPKTLIIRR